MHLEVFPSLGHLVAVQMGSDTVDLAARSHFYRVEDQSQLQACFSNSNLVSKLDSLIHSMLRWLSVLTQILVLEAGNLPRPPQGVAGYDEDHPKPFNH